MAIVQEPDGTITITGGGMTIPGVPAQFAPEPSPDRQLQTLGRLGQAAPQSTPDEIAAARAGLADIGAGGASGGGGAEGQSSGVGTEQTQVQRAENERLLMSVDPSQLVSSDVGPTAAAAQVPQDTAAQGQTEQGVNDQLAQAGASSIVRGATQDLQPRVVSVAPRPAQDVSLGQTVQTQRGAQIDPASIEAEQAALQGLAGNQLLRGDALKAANEQSATEFLRQAEESQRQAAALRERDRDRQKVVQGELATLRQKSQDIREEKLDPNRIYADGGNSIAASIFIALDQLGSTFSGNSPVVGKMITDAVETDLARQRAERDFRLQSIGERQNLLQELEGSMISPQAAEQGTRALLLEAAAKQIQAQSAKLVGTDAESQANVLAQQTLAEAAKARQQAEAATADAVTVNERFQHVAARRGGTFVRQPTEREKAAAADKIKKGLGLTGPDADKVARGIVSQAVNVSPGFAAAIAPSVSNAGSAGALTPDAQKLIASFRDRAVRIGNRTLFANRKADATKIQGFFTIAGEAERRAKDLLAINAQGGETLSPNARARAATDAEFLIGNLGKLLEKGVLSKEEREQIEPLGGLSVTDFFGFEATQNERLKTVLRNLQFGRSSRVSQLSQNTQGERLLASTGDRPVPEADDLGAGAPLPGSE